jgi:hypothetical protein
MEARGGVGGHAPRLVLIAVCSRRTARRTLPSLEVSGGISMQSCRAEREKRMPSNGTDRQSVGLGLESYWTCVVSMPTSLCDRNLISAGETMGQGSHLTCGLTLWWLGLACPVAGSIGELVELKDCCEWVVRDQDHLRKGFWSREL